MREHGGSAHRWRRLLAGPDPEAVYDELLARLCPGAQVLEAGPGDGPDAARFGPLNAGWTGCDFSPALPALARLGWTLAGEWQLGEGFGEDLWHAGLTERGLAYREERHIVLAEAPA